MHAQWRSTNVLAGGGLKSTIVRLLGFQIVHVCFPEVGDSVVGVLYMPGPGDLASKAATLIEQVTWFTRMCVRLQEVLGRP